MLVELQIKKLDTAGLGERVEITWCDGSSEFVRDGSGRLERAQGCLVPAPLGYAYFEAFMVGGAFEVQGPLPVVAFRLSDGGGRPVPVTLAGEIVARARSLSALMLPNGSCFDMEHDEVYFAELSKWKASAAERLRGSAT